MPVHIDNHRMLLIVRGVIRIECGDNAVALGIRLCSKRLAIIGQRFRFFNRIGRHLGLRRIDIAALPRRSIERNIFDAFAGRRCCQAFGDLRFTCEIAFVRRIGRVPELVGECIERRADKVLVRRFRRLRIETRAVRRQRDGAVCRCVLDAEVAALHRRRRCRLMRVEYPRIAAVVVDRDVLIVLLEDHPRIAGIAAAFQRGEMAAGKRDLFENSRGLIPILIVPHGTVRQ